MSELTRPLQVFVSGPASWNTLIHLDELPQPRPQMVRAQRHWQTLGGTSAGKALNLAGLGAQVVLRTVVGHDAAGVEVVRSLDVDGVELIVERAEGASEQHVNLMTEAGERLSIYLELPDLVGEQQAERTAAALAGCEVAVLDLAEHNLRLLEAARSLGRPVWCDVHDHNGTDAFHRPWLQAADVLFLNDDRLDDPLAFMRARVEAGAGLVVCTQGAGGATAVTAEGVMHVPAPPVPHVVDTNGAGDAFLAGFLVASRAGADVRASLAAGHAQAARCLAVDRLAP